MGVVNVTDDSFSDGGRYLDPDRAVEHGVALVAAGRGDHRRRRRVDPARRRPRRRRRRDRPGAPGRQRACRARDHGQHRHHARGGRARPRWRTGASIVNDVSGGRADPDMAPRGRRRRGAVGADALAIGAAPTGRTTCPHYGDVVAEVRDELLAGVDAAVAAGVDPANADHRSRSRVSPRPHNTTGRCCTRCRSWSATGIPVLVGASRKRFLGALLADADGDAAAARTAARPPPR